MSIAKPRVSRAAPSGPTVYLLSYDNGQDYEDHRETPLFLAPSRQMADAIVAEAAAWVEREREKLPPCPLTIDADREAAGEPKLPDEEWVRLSNVRQDHIKTRRPPYGIKELCATLDEHGSEVWGKLTVTKLQFLR